MTAGQAAIVSRGAARGGAVLRAVRDEPLDDADSGWAFTAGDDAVVAGAKVWSLEDVLRREPALRPFLDRPPGTILERASPADPWRQFPGSG